MSTPAPSALSSTSTSSPADHGHFEPLTKTLAENKPLIDEVHASADQPLDPVFLSDPTLTYRFLKGWKFDVPTAVQRVNTARHYRSQHNLSSIREKAIHLPQSQFPHADQILKYWPHVILHGQDKRGQPLSIERLGHSNPSVLTQVVTLDQLMLYHHYHMENKGHLFSTLSTSTDTVIRGCKIMDLQGLGKQHLTSRGYHYFRAVITASQDNYPETMGSLFIVNAPWIFPIAWKTISPLLHAATREKIHILGSDYKAQLQQYIDPKHIPVEFGGTCTCNGKGCVPLYNPEDDMNKVQVKAGGKIEHGVKLEKVEGGKAHLVSYEFRLHSHDIGFEMVVVRGDGTKEVLVVGGRRGSEGMVVDAVTVEGEGEVRVTFDNSYSRFTGKTLWFRVDVQEIGEQEIAASKEIAEEEEKRSPRSAEVEGAAAAAAAADVQ